MEEVRDRDGISEGSSPVMIFCMIVAGENMHPHRPSSAPVNARSDFRP